MARLAHRISTDSLRHPAVGGQSFESFDTVASAWFSRELGEADNVPRVRPGHIHSIDIYRVRSAMGIAEQHMAVAGTTADALRPISGPIQHGQYFGE